MCATQYSAQSYFRQYSEDTIADLSAEQGPRQNRVAAAILLSHFYAPFQLCGLLMIHDCLRCNVITKTEYMCGLPLVKCNLFSDSAQSVRG